MTLINQPSKMPSRKMMAMIIATVLVQGGLAAANALVLMVSPEAVIEIPAEDLIAVIVPLITGYQTRERA